MLAYRYPLIAREGWLWIAAVAVLAALVNLSYGVLSSPLWLLVLVLLFLFRDPMRKIPAAPLGIVSPVDGTIVAIDDVQDGYLNRPAICISVKMGFTSVYSAHCPMEGKVQKQWLAVPRKIQNANSNVSAKEADTYAQWIQSDEGDDLVMVTELGTHLLRPQYYAQSGERVGQGQRCGFICFGSQVDVLIPKTSHVDVSVGDRVFAGSDIIATLVHAKAAMPTKPAQVVVNA
jgi:phosphatidylserine decarboxylase